MAGGRGARMGGQVPKPLVPVRGLALLERNLLRLLAQGFHDIVVTTPAHTPSLRRYVEGRGMTLARAVGARLSVFEEVTPRGTVGAAAELAGRDPVLVLYADNLTTLDLTALIAAHQAEPDTAMTLAVHDEPFVIPFGRIQVRAGRVERYDEKPSIRVPVASGVYVLGAAALAWIPRDRPVGTNEVVDALLEVGATVRAFTHDASWIDVNDPVAVHRAEQMLAVPDNAFECWSGAPDRRVVGAVLRSAEGVLLERRPDDARCYAGCWDTPGGKIEPGESPEGAMRRELMEELGFDPGDLRALATFDDLDPTTGRVFRHHVFVATLDRMPRAREGQRLAWHGSLAPLNPVVGRSLAYLEA